TRHNYMFHREIYAKVAALFELRRANKAYALIDLGCGSVRFLAPALLQSPPAYYEGVDLSENALEEAAGYLESVSGVHLRRHGDLLEAMATTDRKWDVVFSGFALHHLALDQKAAFFDAVATHLSEEGWFLLVDVLRDESQTREAYLDRYIRMMRSTWPEIPPDQLEQACVHVAECDYPEDMSTLSEMAKMSGLNSTLAISRYGQHCSILFTRNIQPEVTELL
ncbi:MAG: class I SAM-dependent methyltransferase, partial [Gallionella sp.]